MAANRTRKKRDSNIRLLRNAVVASGLVPEHIYANDTELPPYRWLNEMLKVRDSDIEYLCAAAQFMHTGCTNIKDRINDNELFLRVFYDLRPVYLKYRNVIKVSDTKLHQVTVMSLALLTVRECFDRAEQFWDNLAHVIMPTINTPIYHLKVLLPKSIHWQKTKGSDMKKHEYAFRILATYWNKWCEAENIVMSEIVVPKKGKMQIAGTSVDDIGAYKYHPRITLDEARQQLEEDFVEYSFKHFQS